MEEERYRALVQAELAKPQSRKAKVLELLNSPFVLWFLSSIVLAGITTGAASWYSSHEERLRTSERVLSLSIELSSRINGLSKVIEDSEYRSKKYSQFTSDEVRAFRDAINASISDCLFQEYKDVDLRGLLWQLTVLTDAKPEVKKSLKAAIELNGILKNDWDPLVKQVEAHGPDAPWPSGTVESRTKRISGTILPELKLAIPDSPL